MTQLSSLLAKIQAADSNSSVDSLHQLMKEVDRYGSTSTVYDSAALLPNHPSFIGSAIVTGDGGFYVFTDSAQWELVDSSVAPLEPEPYTFQGSISGYSSGGQEWQASGGVQLNIIQKYPFSSDGNSTDVGDLTQNRYFASGQVSSTDGYTSGGLTTPPTVNYDIIDKFPFAADANATDHGDLTEAVRLTSGQSSEDNGYVAGGTITPGSSLGTYQKFPFASSANAASAANLSANHFVFGSTGQSSTDNGYVSGGYTPPTSSQTSVINKFPFSSDTNATYVGALTLARKDVSAASSSTHGYTAGGTAPASSNIIDKFPFTSDASATDVGDITNARGYTTGTSSTTNGYATGGHSNFNVVNIIEKYSFTSDANSTDAGDLSFGNQGIQSAAGQQV